MTDRSVSFARHSTDTAASDTPLGERVYVKTRREGWSEGDREGGKEGAKEGGEDGGREGRRERG